MVSSATDEEQRMTRSPPPDANGHEDNEEDPSPLGAVHSSSSSSGETGCGSSSSPSPDSIAQAESRISSSPCFFVAPSHASLSNNHENSGSSQQQQDHRQGFAGRAIHNDTSLDDDKSAMYQHVPSFTGQPPNDDNNYNSSEIFVSATLIQEGDYVQEEEQQGQPAFSPSLDHADNDQLLLMVEGRAVSSATPHGTPRNGTSEIVVAHHSPTEQARFRDIHNNNNKTWIQ